MAWWTSQIPSVVSSASENVSSINDNFQSEAFIKLNSVKPVKQWVESKDDKIIHSVITMSVALLASIQWGQVKTEWIFLPTGQMDFQILNFSYVYHSCILNFDNIKESTLIMPTCPSTYLSSSSPLGHKAIITPYLWTLFCTLVCTSPHERPISFSSFITDLITGLCAALFCPPDLGPSQGNF